MKDFFAMVAWAAFFFAFGTAVMEGNVWGGVVAAAVVVVLMQVWKCWKNFLAKHPKLAEASKVLLCTLGVLLILFLSMEGIFPLGAILGLVIGGAMLVSFFNALPGIRRREKQKTEEFLASERAYWQENTEDYRRKKALDEQKRKAARAEAENLEEMARLWERNAKKYGKPSDIRKARDYRRQADEAWRKVR